MKQIAIALTVLVAAIGCVQGRPRYLVIPIEDVEFMENMELPVYGMPPPTQMHHRVRRYAQEPTQGSLIQDGASSGEPIFLRPVPAQRRDGGPPHHIGGPPPPPHHGGGDIPVFAIPAEIRQAEDAITAGSNSYGHASHGPDYVDYGAYTGGYGAFGWYSDHPVLTYHR